MTGLHVTLRRAILMALACAFPAGLAGGDPVRPDAGTRRLKIGIVQMARAPDFQGNRERIVAGISAAAGLGARVAVFPEGALNNVRGDEPESVVADAVAAIRRAAAANNIHVILAGANRRASAKPGDTAYSGNQVNWMGVIGPDGTELFHYEKLYDNRRAKMPGVFEIDGVPCSTMICADRWLRGVEEIPIQLGAQVSFELSDNYECEWVAPYGWYWYVPRAMRNNVWVVLANGANTVAGVPDGLAWDPRLRHGHSAVIAPDGRVVAATGEAATVVLAEIEVDAATRAEARARAQHPVLRPFWEAGLRLQRGESVPAPPLAALESPAIDITLAVAQVTGDVAQLTAAIREARAQKADLVVFPERACAETALPRLQEAAREHQIAVVFGAEHRVGDHVRNSAFALGPDGTVLTRYDQIAATAPYRSGTDPASMWFRVNGVPAVITIGRDALWTELAELPAVAGAQIHVHLEHDAADTSEARLRRRQVWSNLASYLTFTATANVVGSAIWDDLSSAAEVRHAVRNTPKPQSGPIEVYSAFSANLVTSATAERPLIAATRRVAKTNRYMSGRPANNPQMEPWYRIGAAIIRPRVK